MKNSAFPSTAPKTAEELVQRARELIQQQQFDEALKRLEESLEIKKTAPAYRNIGNIHFARRDAQRAIPFFQQALQTDHADHASNAMLAETYFFLKDAQAFGYSALAIAAEPKEIRYKERFIVMAQEVAFSQYNGVIENTLLECLRTPNLDSSGAQGLWYNTFTLNPAFQPLYRIATGQKGGFLSGLIKSMVAPQPALVMESAGMAFDDAHFDKAKDYTPLLKPFFLLGLKKIIVYSKPLEQFLTHLRKVLLLEPERFTPQLRLAVAAALSHYCFNTEYIFEITAEETQALEKLEESPVSVALNACYAPLYDAEKTRKLAESFASTPELASVMRVQITEAKALADARASIPALTPIADGVSQAVRQQYEESPYPKWKTVPRNLILENVAAGLRKPGAKILIAGCGTGQEAAQIATVLPEAEILAVDLSLASLAYAQVKTKEQGFKNITFRQADILQLGVLPDKFDGIISGGVLHHLQDPLAGWQVLANLLKDDGIMRIALYSKTARRHLVAAQEAVKKGNYPATPDGMRAFRKEAPKLLNKEVLNNIMGVSDYYHMSMFRDMIFHVQEHCFDLPRLGDALKRLHLELVKFILPQAVAAQYLAAFPADTAAVSLENWHKFEQQHPDTFIGMYQFWCRKKQG